MKNINYIIGTSEICRTPLPPYSETACEFAAELSAALMKNPDARLYPDIMSFAFWCRKSNIYALKEQFPSKQRRLGRGLVFHVAPSNVPLNFAFTYMFALLAGNSSIVRIPSKPFPQIEIVCKVLKQILEHYPEIEKRTAIIQYPPDLSITQQLCLIADARVIWGGDQTVSDIRSCPAKPRCLDLTFADRYSFCVINGDAVLKADERELGKLAENFYNDTYLMDQNACSSPQLICWKNGSGSARQCFWEAVFNYTKKRYRLQDASTVDKYTQMCLDAVNYDFVTCVRHQENLIYRIELTSLPDDLTALRGNSGYFYEYELGNLEDLNGNITEKFQTLTYYGVSSEELREYVLSSHARGIDRIVPVGKALDIGIIWDGYDIVGTLSRIVDVI